MAETRIDKYKDYRDSFTKNESKAPAEANKPKRSSSQIHTTNTLSLEDVMGKAEETNKVEITSEWKKKKIKMIAIIAAISVAVITVIVILGIKAFGGK